MKIPNSIFKIKPAFNITWVLEFNDLPRTTGSDKVLHDKAFNIPKNPKHDAYQRGLSSMVYKCFDKTSSGDVATLSRSEALATRDEPSIKSEIILNQQLAGELHKPIRRKFEK